MNEGLSLTPVIIIGAGRSGTNALRDALTALPGFATWDCDEINPIWRHGNLGWPNDEFPADLASPAVRSFVRGAFVKLWKQKGQPPFVVEKTCANALRVPFVNAILPEARYIHIVRDGVDVLASARKRWQGDLELPGLPYFLAKARYTPLRDLPIYGLSFLRSRIGMALGKSDRLAIWGPRFAGMSDMKDADLEELCARQWVACIDRADAAFADVDNARVFTLRYEDFTRNAAQTLQQILAFLGTEASQTQISAAAAPIRADSVGKGHASLSGLKPRIQALMRNTLERHGFGD